MGLTAQEDVKMEGVVVWLSRAASGKQHSTTSFQELRENCKNSFKSPGNGDAREKFDRGA